MEAGVYELPRRAGRDHRLVSRPRVVVEADQGCRRGRLRSQGAVGTVTPAGTRRISVDMDSLLAGSSLRAECLVEALRRNPLTALRLPLWAMRGRAVLEQRLAQYADLDVAALPYRTAAVDEMRRSVGDGAHVVLVTTAEPALARKVAEHLGIGEVQAGQARGRRARPGLRWIGRTLRPYQWLKNALVFVPFLLSHEVAASG